MNPKKAIATFKQSIEAVLSGLNDKTGHLVVIIDELDRCRPTFSIELLERVKHLFGVPGVVFVLAVDREQLSHGINAVYGSGFDARGYLRRFIDFTYRLQSSDVKQFIEGLLGAFELDNVLARRGGVRAFRGEQQAIVELLQMFVTEWRLTLRQLEQVVAQLNIVIRGGDYNEYLFPPLTLFLLLLRMVDEQIYSRYLSTGRDPEVVLSYLDQKYGNSFTNRPVHLASVEGAFLATFNNDTSESASSLKEARRKIAASQNEVDPGRDYCRWVLRWADEPMGMSFPHSPPLHVDHLLSRIEFLEHIDLERE